MRRTLFVALLLLSACKNSADDSGFDTDTGVLDTGDTQDTAADTEDTEDTTNPWEGNQGPEGFIGGPCETNDDCDFSGGTCLHDGYGDHGMCSMACSSSCPDEAGKPVTFCVGSDDLTGDALDLGQGACHSRCDFGAFPDEGCRPGYGCAVVARPTGSEYFACMPDRASDLDDCYYDLADRGVAFEPAVKAPEQASGASGNCVVDNPLYLFSPVDGVALKYYDGSATPRVFGACGMAHAIADTVADVKPRGATALRHIGTYNCRVIAGTSTLSQHSFGDAIDIYGFEVGSGSVYTLIDHWEHNTTNPQSTAARFLYDAAWRWYDAKIWNIILTPNYNAAHDNHFHVDLTPQADYIGRQIRHPHPMISDCGGPPLRDRLLDPLEP